MSEARLDTLIDFYRSIGDSVEQGFTSGPQQAVRCIAQRSLKQVAELKDPDPMVAKKARNAVVVEALAHLRTPHLMATLPERTRTFADTVVDEIMDYSLSLVDPNGLTPEGKPISERLALRRRGLELRKMTDMIAVLDVSHDVMHSFAQEATRVPSPLPIT